MDLHRQNTVCPRVIPFLLDDWASAAEAFKKSTPVYLGQHWLPQPEAGFLPTRVRTAWTDNALLVLAELDDTGIFNPSREFNAPAFKMGDVFEIFLRPIDQQAYYEFHIGPDNQKISTPSPIGKGFSRASPGRHSTGMAHWQPNHRKPRQSPRTRQSLACIGFHPIRNGRGGAATRSRITMAIFVQPLRLPSRKSFPDPLQFICPRDAGELPSAGGLGNIDLRGRFTFSEPPIK